MILITSQKKNSLRLLRIINARFMIAVVLLHHNTQRVLQNYDEFIT